MIQFFVLFYFETGFLFVRLGCLGTPSVDLAGLNSQRSTCLCLPSAGLLNLHIFNTLCHFKRIRLIISVLFGSVTCHIYFRDLDLERGSNYSLESFRSD